MSWGVATQNGVSVSLASIVSLSAGVTEFSPADLFTSGVQGAWYDPSDYSTLFQDSAGTTPVTAVEQPVRLMLDKSQGLVLGSELVTDGTLWTAVAPTTSSWNSGTSTVRVTGGASGGSYYNFASVAGVFYKLTFTVSVVSAGTWYMIGKGASNGGGSNNIVNSDTVGKTVTCYFAATSTTSSLYIQITSGGVIDVSGITLKAIPGNHALAPNDPSRPMLRARYNLLTYSEQFNNGAWSLNAAAVTANQEVAPDGTTTADKVANSTTTLDYPLIYQGFTLSAAATVTQTVYAKVGSANFLSMGTYDGTVVKFSGFNLSNGTVNVTAVGHTVAIVDVGGGWYRCSVTYAYPATTARTYAGVYKTSGTPQYIPSSIGADFIYIWGADARIGSSAGTYQRIAAATDYATAGFLPYLYFVTDDSFGTNSIDFTATDKMAVCAGVTKLSDASAQIVCELSATSSAGNNGSFAIISALSPSNYAFYLYGNALASRTATTYASPVTNVVSVKYDISQSTVPNEIAPQINGAVPTLADAGGAGTGNFGNYPLYIGRRNNASLPFNGNLYQLIVCGKALSASELASTEAYVNSKTGAY